MRYLQDMSVDLGFWGVTTQILWVFTIAFILAVLASLVVLVLAAIRALNAYSHHQRLRTAMLLAEHNDG
jgi:hypothetical protein